MGEPWGARFTGHWVSVLFLVCFREAAQRLTMKVPLALWNIPHWELSGRVDTVQFFEALTTGFPSATTLFLEGTCIAKDVQEFLHASADAGPYLPARQTIWPRPQQFRLRADEVTLKRMAELAASHAEPEMLGHIFVYAGEEPLMEYPDAFLSNSPMYVSQKVGEHNVQWFGRQLRLKVAEVGT